MNESWLLLRVLKPCWVIPPLRYILLINDTRICMESTLFIRSWIVVFLSSLTSTLIRNLEQVSLKCARFNQKGAVKITPAHDFNDFKVGQRNNLEFITIFTDEGQINENGGSFAVRFYLF